MFLKYNLVLLLTFIHTVVLAQDSLVTNLRQADSLFLARNYYLLAATMNIEAHKAKEIQAALYPNPVATADVNLYDPQNARFLHAGSTGQKGFHLEQLIILGGKRKAEIDLAKTETAIAEFEFQDLIRELKYRLHFGLFAIGQHKQLLKIYNNQLLLLDSLVVSNQSQVSMGNLPVRDLVRLKGAYLKLNNDRAELLKNDFALQTELQTLLQSDIPIDFTFGEDDIVKYIRSTSLDELNGIALEFRPDLLIGQKKYELADQYWVYQKKLAVSDMNIFAFYDQRSGAFDNQVNVGVSIPLPLWNKNQGNIKAAQHRMVEASLQLHGIRNQLLSEIRNSYHFYLQTVEEYRKASRLYDENFEETLAGMIDNFRKRNLSLIEFIDFFESYNEVLTELGRIKIQLVSSGEELNRLIGKDVY